jgi:hypothetical protein
MAVDIKNLIAAINPDLYCVEYKESLGQRENLRQQVKKIAKEEGYLKAAEKAKLVESSFMDFDDDVYHIDPFKLPGLKNPIEKHELVYDSFGESLEPIYFWLIDTINKEYKDMKKIDKLVDNFMGSPGSSHFSEMGMKATKMQEEAMKLLSTANQIVKSILNIIYDLKEFKLRLALYKNLKSEKPEVKNSAMLSLKQVWMDTVDMKRGNTALKALALGGQAQFVTLIDAFMTINDLADLDPKNKKALDLNDRVRRLLQQKVGEFLDWLKESEKELTKRFEIEKIYLKSQVNSIKMYARWAKPYLKAAKALEQNATPTAALVTAFNTAIFELVLLGESEYKPSDDVNKGDLPKVFLTTPQRKYAPIIIVELKFRSIPERMQQGGYGFRGRVEIIFTSFALNNEELKVMREEAEKDDFGDAWKAIEGATEESMEKINTDIEEILEDKEEKEDKKESGEDTNPFSSLISMFKPEKKEKNSSKDSKKTKEVAPDNYHEKVIRSQALIKAHQECRKIYDMYKKAHGMATF